jgi:hypothetical protein
LKIDSKRETREQRYIKLLSTLAEADAPISTDETWLLSDIADLAALAQGGYVSVGQIVRGCDGVPCAIACAEINPSGIRYLAELKQKQEAGTSVGQIKQNRFGFYKWFFGIVGAVAAVVIGGLLLRLCARLFGL